MSDRGGAPLPTTGHALFRWARANRVLAHVVIWGRQAGLPALVIDWPPKAVSDGYAVGRAVLADRAAAEEGGPATTDH
jgi:hypothetical protein